MSPLRVTRGRVATVDFLGVATTATAAALGLNVVIADHRMAQLRNAMGSGSTQPSLPHSELRTP